MSASDCTKSQSSLVPKPSETSRVRGPASLSQILPVAWGEEVKPREQPVVADPLDPAKQDVSPDSAKNPDDPHAAEAKRRRGRVIAFGCEFACAEKREFPRPHGIYTRY